MKPAFLEKALSMAGKLDFNDLVKLLNLVAMDDMRLEAAIQSMFDGIIVCNREHIPVIINKSAERILKIPSDFGNKPLWQGIADEDLKQFFHEGLISEENIMGNEFAIDCPGGTRIIAISLSTLVFSEKISGTIIHIEDITEKRKRETQLRRAESLAALTTLAAGVAHEINNPLGSLSIHIQLMERLLKNPQKLDDKALQHHLGIVKEEIDKLEHIVKDFLFAVRPMDIQLLNQDLKPILEELAEFVRPEAEKYNIKLKVSVQKDLPKILLDKRHLKQALLNLIQNAIAAMSDGGTLKLEAKKADEEIRILVSDTGIGIPEELLTKIFEPYFTTKKNGTGLGLTITFKIIKEHAGDISIESKPGKGTTFTIHLPIPQAERKSLPIYDEDAVSAGSHVEA